jgi:hypothetical protein
MPHFFKTALFLFVLNLFSENIGSFSKPLNAFIGFSVFSAFFWLNLPPAIKPLNLLNRIIFITFLLAVILIFPLHRIQLLMLLSTCLFMLLWLSSSYNENRFDLCTQIFASIGYTTLIISSEHSTIIWYILQYISKFISVTASVIPDYTVNYSISYSGILITASFLTFFLVSILTAKNIRASVVFLFLSLTIFFQSTYVLLHSYLLTFPLFYYGLDGRTAIDLNVILFIFMLIPLFFYLKSISISWVCSNLSIRWVFPIVILIAAGSYLKSAYTTETHAPNSKGRILFCNEGHLDWNLPIFGVYGGEKGGMFGVLLRELKFHGFEVAVSGIDQENLSRTNVLVLINLNRKFNEKEKEIIWNFVKTGGSLLILGDHTGQDIIREPYNDLLSRVGIQFNFDSAISRISKWTNGFKHMHHYINRQILDENDVQIWIGASLAITYPARPVIIGKNAFSDLGNISALQTGYLGDMRYAHGERLGDIVLVAEADYGQGTVLVFGDTSPFQNSALALSSAFVGRIFEYLANPEEKAWFRTIPLIDIILIIALVLLVTQKARFRICLVSVFCLSSAIFCFVAFNMTRDPAEKFGRYPKLALIDASHFERLSLDLWGESDGFGGLIYSLLRNGFFPIVMRDFNSQRLGSAQLLVVVAPAKSFSRAEIESIEAFVRRGGQLIITVGWPDRSAVRSLLELFSFSIGNTPLGRVTAFQNKQGITLHNAWPVIYDQKVGTPLCDVWEYSVIVYSHYGKGGVLIVGDSSFLLNKNLEGMRNYVESNIIFLREFINKYFTNEEMPY